MDVLDDFDQSVVELGHRLVRFGQQGAGVPTHDFHQGDPVRHADVHQVDHGLVIVAFAALLEGLADQVLLADRDQIAQQLPGGDVRRGRRHVDHLPAGADAERIVEQPHGAQGGRQPEGGLAGRTHFTAEKSVKILLMRRLSHDRLRVGKRWRPV